MNSVGAAPAAYLLLRRRSEARSRRTLRLLFDMAGKRYCARFISTEQGTKLCRSELPANDIMRSFNTPRPFLLRLRVPILRHCVAFVTNFTAAECSALYSKLHERVL
ncbi:hypothetical protein EVAR_100216_1 [Eumeta japonica]|uniref:Uncharacterized protein n=1 Tax=Eumeta variegata TaxID=151549 RepID=A0A4C1ZGG4_EUMVA|nr:hypothetical protein EVAR_100216_1 [Eumeta japonica]